MNYVDVSAWFLAGFFIFVAVFYTCRLIVSSKPREFMGKPCSQHWFGHISFRFFRVVILLVCALRIPYGEIDQYLMIFDVLMQPAVIYSGMVLMLAGFGLTVFGHFSLGQAWTSGLDPDGPHALIKTGIYHISRNPMFLGVLIAQFGFFLALPGGFTLLCLVIGYVAVLNQVRLEEQFLSTRFGQRYQEYAGEVPRWLGWPSPGH